jgi:hypothetical protein
MRNSLYLFALALVFSCSKEPTELIPNNVAPPDYTVDRVNKENYINKLYISMLGREPNTDEFNSARDLLGDGVTQESREILVENVQAKEEYYDNMFNIIRQDLINGVDTNQIREDYIDGFEEALENSDDPFEIQEIEEGLVKLYLLYNSTDDLKANTATITEIQGRCVNNFIYDEINMGSFNYVVSIYQNFLHRYPTEYEIENGVKMLDDEQAVCFGGNGNSKSDFNTLFFNHDGYYEGQVINIYNRILFRNPSSSESYELTTLFKSNKDYKELQKRILITDEYLGIE